MLLEQLELLIRGLWAQHDQGHVAGTIVTSMKGVEAFHQAVVGEGGRVSRMAGRRRVAWVEQLTQRGQAVQGRVGQARSKLGFQHRDLIAYGSRVEARPSEQVDQSRHALIGSVHRQMQMDVGGSFYGAGIVTAALGADPAGQLTLAGPAMAAQEEPVFQQVSEATAIRGVVEITCGDRPHQP